MAHRLITTSLYSNVISTPEFESEEVLAGKNAIQNTNIQFISTSVLSTLYIVVQSLGIDVCMRNI